MKKTNILVFDGQSENLIATLSNKDNEQCPFTESESVEQLNKDFTLDFSVPASHEDSRHLVRGNLVGFFDLDGNLQVFQIYKTEEDHTGDELSKVVFSEHLFYEMADDIVQDLRVNNGTALDAMTKALSASRWNVGTVDELGTGSVNFYYSNALVNIQDTANEFGGELQFRFVTDGKKITNRLVDLKARRGADTGHRFTFTKDLVSVKRTEEMDGLKTALYGRGKGEETEAGTGYSRKTTFRDVVWRVIDGDPVDKPLGQEWVGLPEALSKFGRENGTRHRYGTFDFDTTDPEELLRETFQQLQRVSVPVVTYELSVITLEQLTGYDHTKVRLGDTVFVIDRELGLTIEARVLEIKRDLENPENTEIILGNFIEDITDYNKKIEEVEAKLTDRQGIWDKVEDIDVEVDDDTIVNEAPSVPTNVSAQGLFKSIILKWSFDPSIRISAYEVYASKVNGFTPDSSNLVFRGKTGGFVLDGQTNETWYFRIRALNPHGVTSAFTQQFSASTIALTQPDFENLTVTNAMIEEVSADKITFGTLDGNKADIVNLNADNIVAGKLKAQYVQIGSSTTYEVGYDPTTKATPSDVQTAKEEAVSEANNYTDGQLVDYVDATTYGQDLQAIQDQIDGAITTWFYDGEPTLTNAPASEWTTTELKNKHLGDLYYDGVTGYAYRFQLSGGNYSWVMLQDSDVQKALADASEAKDTADQKRRVFVSQPVPPYDIGDLWTQGTSGELMRAKVARASGSYNAGDWEKATKYTDDTRAVQAESNAKGYADGKLAEAKTAWEQYAEARAEYHAGLAEAHADGLVTAEEQARIDALEQTMIDAKLYADEKKQEAITASNGYTDDKTQEVKDLTRPVMKEVYDAGFQHGLEFWSWEYQGDDVETFTEGTVAPSEDAEEGGNLLSIQGSEFIYSKNAFPVNVNRVYRVTMRVRQTVDSTSGGSNVYAGVATLDGNFQALTGGAGTHRYCAVAGNSIAVADGWQTFTGLITGVGANADNFRDGTVFVRPMAIVNYSGGNGTTEVDYIKFEDVTEVYNLQTKVDEVDLRTTDTSIISTVRSAIETDLNNKADASALDGYATTDYADQVLTDAQDYTDTEVGNVTDILGTNPDTEGKTVFEQITAVDQKADQIDFKFTSSGGVNLLKNSIGYSGTDFWWVAGTVETRQDIELDAQGSGSAFILKGATMTQEVTIAPDWYTFSCKVKKGSAGYGYVKVIYDGQEEIVEFLDGTEYDYKEVEIIIETTGNKVTVELHGNTELALTGIILNKGNVALAWQHSAGEIYNTNVLMDLNGIRVIANTYNGYTAITPEEFAGYAEVPNENNEPEMKKVFTLNKDVTEMSKANIEKELTMTPVKIIPVTSPDFNGIAFISEE
jgi:phage minor structural protein